MRCPPRSLALAAVAVTAVTAGFGSATSSASSSPVPVTVTVGTACGSRTATVTDGAGQALSSGNPLVLTPGHPASVRATVTDTGACPTSFSVSATMSNLYAYSGSSYDFGTQIPSNDITLGRPASALTLTGLTNSVTPVFQLVGSGGLLSLLSTVLGHAVSSVTLSSLTSLQPVGVAAPSGTVTDGTLAGLPLTFASDAATAFANSGPGVPSDPHVSGSPTSVTVVSGTPQGLSLSSVSSSVFGASPLTGTTLTNLGLLDPNTVIGTLESALGATLTPLIISLLGGVSGILGGLTASVTGCSTTSCQPLATGAYTGNATVNVTPPGGATPGSYRGVLTVNVAP